MNPLITSVLNLTFYFKYTLRNKKLYMTVVVVYCEVVYDFILLHSGSFRSDLNHKCKNHSISAFLHFRGAGQTKE